MNIRIRSVLTAALAAAMLMTGCADSSSDTAEGSRDVSSSYCVDEKTGNKIVASGHIGDTSNGGKAEDVEWKIVDAGNDDCTLEIRGKGSANVRMKNFAGGGELPYLVHKSKIRWVRVYDVANIGDYALSGLNKVGNISIDDSVTEIGKYAFRDSGNITRLNMSRNIKSIGDKAFLGCYGLRDIIGHFDSYSETDGYAYCSFGDSLTDIGEKAFDCCDSLLLKCKEGSKLLDYAKKNNIKYEIVK